jgi:formate hydrogenlyase transcriptional activator
VSLTSRAEGLPILVKHFVGKYGSRVGRESRYDWPGNIRELENVIERAVVLAGSDDVLQVETTSLTRPEASDRLADVERMHILAVVESCRWKIGGPNGAASVLGLAPSTLRDKMRKLDIDRP